MRQAVDLIHVPSLAFSGRHDNERRRDLDSLLSGRVSALNEENFTRTRQRIRMILNTRLELARLEYWNALNTVRRVQQW